jgi:hypothetical protein
MVPDSWISAGSMAKSSSSFCTSAAGSSPGVVDASSASPPQADTRAATATSTVAVASERFFFDVSRTDMGSPSEMGTAAELLRAASGC